MAYEYVKSVYGVNPEPGQRVTSKDGTKAGVISKRRSYDHYVYVTLDGTKFAVPFHPDDLVYGASQSGRPAELPTCPSAGH